LYVYNCYVTLAYTDTCCKINTIYDDADVVHAITAGAFNRQIGTSFCNVFYQCMESSKLALTDIKHLLYIYKFISHTNADKIL